MGGPQPPVRRPPARSSVPEVDGGAEAETQPHDQVLAGDPFGAPTHARQVAQVVDQPVGQLLERGLR